MQTIRVAILDDLGQPELEGIETFELVLRMPVNGILGEPAKAKVFINDSVSDCKRCSLFTFSSSQNFHLVSGIFFSCLFKDMCDSLNLILSFIFESQAAEKTIYHSRCSSWVLFFFYIFIVSHQSSFCTWLQQLRVFNEIFKTQPARYFQTLCHYVLQPSSSISLPSAEGPVPRGGVLWRGE